MGRLIDADEVEKCLVDYIEKLNTPKNFLTKLYSAMKEDVIDIINEQPTAYDVDKVVEELDKENMSVDHWMPLPAPYKEE